VSGVHRYRRDPVPVPPMLRCSPSLEPPTLEPTGYTLGAPAARLFRLLGIHTGPDIAVPAAASLCGLPTDRTRALLAELTAAHLVAETAPGRYACHDLLRAYAAELAQADPTEFRRAATARMLDHYLHTADAADRLLIPTQRRVLLDAPVPGAAPQSLGTQAEALAWCEAERPNLTAAVRHAATAGLPALAWRPPVVMWGFFMLRKHWTDWFATADVALNAARRSADRAGQAWARLSGSPGRAPTVTAACSGRRRRSVPSSAITAMARR
jgi:hypothetical protein